VQTLKKMGIVTFKSLINRIKKEKEF
jgi:hypothetical protein